MATLKSAHPTVSPALPQETAEFANWELPSTAKENVSLVSVADLVSQNLLQTV